MLGRLEFAAGGRGRGEVSNLYGLSVLCVRADPEGWLGRHRLERAGRRLSRAGVEQTLLPGEFCQWELLARLGLREVDTAPLLRAQASFLALAGLRRREIDPERAAVVLSGVRAQGEMYRCAVQLCAHVRRVVIAAPGAEHMALRLREEFGIPILPADYPGELELRFHPGQGTGSHYMQLYGRNPYLDGGVLSAPGLKEEEREDIPLLSALWQGGKLGGSGLKFT